MGLVAGLAWHAGGMLLRIHLRKILWPGGAGSVAAYAQHRRVRLPWVDGWIVGVFRLRSVACLAVDVGMLAATFGLGDVRVAGLAGLVSGEMDGTGGDF